MAKRPAKAPSEEGRQERLERGVRIMWARELVEPNRYEFARKMGVDPSTVRYIEMGLRNPSLQMAQMLCHALRIDLDYIMHGRLDGVDAELAQLLVLYHPQLAPPKSARKAGTRRKDPLRSIVPIPQVSWRRA